MMTVSQDKNGYWYAHRVGYPNIPMFGSWSRNKKYALKCAADNMGLTYEQYVKLRKASNNARCKSGR